VPVIAVRWWGAGDGLGRGCSPLPRKKKSLDQAHEQLNANVKGDGGVIGLTQNDTVLHRWIVAGPDVARLLSEFEGDSILTHDSYLHHEQQQPATQQIFVNDVRKLVSSLQRFGNPFEDQHDLVVLNSRRIVLSSRSCRLCG